jgi:hypothetical protein
MTDFLRDRPPLSGVAAGVVIVEILLGLNLEQLFFLGL